MWIQRLFLALILIALVQSWFFGKYGFKNVSYRRWFKPNVATQGDTVTLYEEIRNVKLLPIPWVKIEAETSADLVFGKQGKEFDNAKKEKSFHRSVFSLPPYTTITREHKVYCARRGYYHVKSVALTTGDILGLSPNKSKDIPTDTLLVVYPQLVDISDVFALRSSFQGDIVVRRWIVEDPFMIRGVREYAPTDPQNRINWKATAKTGVMQVHDFDYTSDVRLMILLNVDTHENQWTITSDEPCAERGISIAASVCQYAIDNGIEVGFASNGSYVDNKEEDAYCEAGGGMDQMETIMRALARLSLWRKYSFATMIDRLLSDDITARDILIISAYTDENIDLGIQKLRDAGNNVEVLSVPHTDPDELRRMAQEQEVHA